LEWLARGSFLAIGFIIAYAASRASADQRGLAACVGGTLFLILLYVFLEAQFVRVEFDDEFITHFLRGESAASFHGVLSLALHIPQ
jgi:hypothetical protein